MRRTCVICRKRTENWQRMNGSAWFCYDGCWSTTGVDRRTVDGKPLWKGSKPWPKWTEATEAAGTACIMPTDAICRK